MYISAVSAAFNQWFTLVGQLDLGTLAFGFMAALLTKTAAIELRMYLQTDLPPLKFALIKTTVLCCYVLALFFCACYASLALPASITTSFSLTALFLTFIAMVVFVGGIVALVTKVEHPKRFKVAYSIGTSSLLFAAPTCFILTSQIGNVKSINWIAIGVAIPVLWLIMSFMSNFTYKSNRRMDLPVLERLTHSVSVAGVMLFIVIVIMSTVEFKGIVPDRPWYYLSMSHHSFEMLVTVVAFAVMTIFLIRVYSAVYEQVLGLKSKTKDLTEENIIKEQLVENQRDLLFKTSVRVKELELSLQQEQHSAGISADSLIAAVLNLEDGVFEWDLERHALNLGPSWSELLGISGQLDAKARMETLLRGILPEDWEEARGKIAALLNGTSPQDQAQVRYINPQGLMLKLDVRVVAVRNPYGLPNRLVGILTDRTKDMDAEQAIRSELNAESTHSKLKTDFVTYLSHEIRTPMTIISSANALLDCDIRMNRLHPERAQDYTEQVSNALVSMRYLVDETLSFMSKTGTTPSTLQTGDTKCES